MTEVSASAYVAILDGQTVIGPFWSLEQAIEWQDGRTWWKIWALESPVFDKETET